MSMIEQRKRGTLPSGGPFLAEVTNNLDPTYMGSLEVTLVRGIPNAKTSQNETYVVRYLSPFYGVTSAKFEGNSTSDFNDAQKSYGMWMVPPDIGVTVMVIFVDRDPNQGYWIGCVPDMFQNHMVPSIASSANSAKITIEQERKYQTKNLPVSEFIKKVDKEKVKIENLPKAVHPFADRLLAQGLLLDDVRGVTSSSARREVPSSVFGISTPGPIDKDGRKGPVGYDKSQRIVPVSRLGGSQFVMDDGDVKGQNELVRIRTRTGHQILLHNSQDLIYIANSRGTAWVELTSDGKIDIFAQDSVSIHTKNDFNFRADRDVNIEAMRNINIFAEENLNVECKNLNAIIRENAKVNVLENLNLYAGIKFKLQSKDNLSISSQGEIRLGAAKDLSIVSSQNILESATKIHLNGPAGKATEAPDLPSQLLTHAIEQTSPSAGWAAGNFYKAGTITSIMKRVPQHEPWNDHEDKRRDSVTPTNTDNTVQ